MSLVQVNYQSQTELVQIKMLREGRIFLATVRDTNGSFDISARLNFITGKLVKEPIVDITANVKGFDKLVDELCSNIWQGLYGHSFDTIVYYGTEG